MAEWTLTVAGAPGASAGRLDAFLHGHLPGLPRRLLRRVIAEGAVRVNGRRATKGVTVRAGDRVTLPELPAGVRAALEPGVPVLYEDAELVALDKPGGMPSHALDPRQAGTAAAFVLARYPETARVGEPLAPGLVHRLDTGTSGLLLAARTPDAHAALRAAFAAHAVEKRYLAVVAGVAADVHGRRVEVPLAHHPGDRRRMVAAPPGARAWPAETRLETLAVGADRSLVQATIRSGVTHQVRAHLALVGHPVLGDLLYGGPPVDAPPGRHALHAAALLLAHPADGRMMRLESALPAELRALAP